MLMGWSFPWPFLLVPVVMMVVMVVGRSSIGCGVGSRVLRERRVPLAPPEDPLMTLRERYAHGDIDNDEFARRLDALLRSEPNPAPSSWTS